MTAKFGNDPILLRADMKHKDILCQSRGGGGGLLIKYGLDSMILRSLLIGHVKMLNNLCT